MSDAEVMQSCSYLPEVKSGDRVRVNLGGNKKRLGTARAVGKDTVTVKWLNGSQSTEQVASDKVDHEDAVRCTSHQIQVSIKLNLTLRLQSLLDLHFSVT